MSEAAPGGTGVQLTLPFPFTPRHGSFLPAGSNSEARTWLSRPADWPQGRLAIWGEAGAGKTHLLHLWGAPVIDGADLRGLVPPAGLAADLAIDRAELVPQPADLLHLLNACAEAGCRVVLASRTPPARWNTGLADLDSRLRAMLAVEIKPPEDSLLEALLRQLLSERQIVVAQGTQDWLRLRLPRTAQAMREAAAGLDAASLQAGGPVNRAIAAAVLARLAPGEPSTAFVDTPPPPVDSAP